VIDGGAPVAGTEVSTTGTTATWTFTTSPLALSAGTHTVQAFFDGTNLIFADGNGTLRGGQVVNKANATVFVTPYTVPFDGVAHTATVAGILGVDGQSGATAGTVTLHTTHTAVGTYTDSWTFTGSANYKNIASTTITDAIKKVAVVTIIVNSSSDTPTYAPTVTYSQLQQAGFAKVTLRDALDAADNTVPAAGFINTYVIDLQANTTYDLAQVDNNWYGPDGLPAIASIVTINGNGAVIQRDPGAATPNFRLFYVSGGLSGLAAGSLTLNNVALQGGLALGGSGSTFGGGGLGAGGAIFNQGALVLNGVTLTDNEAEGGAGNVGSLGIGGGGGIGSDASEGQGGGFGGTFPSGIYGGAGGAGGGHAVQRDLQRTCPQGDRHHHRRRRPDGGDRRHRDSEYDPHGRGDVRRRHLELRRRRELQQHRQHDHHRSDQQGQRDGRGHAVQRDLQRPRAQGDRHDHRRKRPDGGDRRCGDAAHDPRARQHVRQ
jgi:hypothetical protein